MLKVNDMKSVRHYKNVRCYYLDKKNCTKSSPSRNWTTWFDPKSGIDIYIS